jgi:hypothetical protein
MSYTLEVQRGVVGGAPPHRCWRSSQSWTVTVEDTTTIADLVQMLQQTCDSSITASRLRFVGGSGSWSPSLDNPLQSISEAGLTKVHIRSEMVLIDEFFFLF